MKHLYLFETQSERDSAASQMTPPWVAFVKENNSLGMHNDKTINEMFNYQSKSVEITENGETLVVPDAGYGALNNVKVKVNVPTGGGGGSASAGAVNFRDYDGTILHSYSKDEFLALNELPPLPTQKGLICQEWNWSLEDAKEYVAEYGVLEVGATYITDDGKTRFYIKVEGDRKTLPINFSINNANSLTIDWGDGASESVSGSGTLNVSHTYDAVGDYVISFEVADGAKLTFTGNALAGIIKNPYAIMLHKIEVGERTSIGDNAFYSCSSLSSIVIPNSVTSIGDNVFSNSHSLSSIVIPNSVTSIGDNAFYSCSSLSSIVIPNSVTSIGDNAFYSCSCIAYFDFRTHTSVPTLSNYSAFLGIVSDAKIVVPDALYDEWIAATNWSNSNAASKIVKASEFNG